MNYSCVKKVHKHFREELNRCVSYRKPAPVFVPSYTENWRMSGIEPLRAWQPRWQPFTVEAEKSPQPLVDIDGATYQVAKIVTPRYQIDLAELRAGLASVKQLITDALNGYFDTALDTDYVDVPTLDSEGTCGVVEFCVWGYGYKRVKGEDE